MHTIMLHVETVARASLIGGPENVASVEGGPVTFNCTSNRTSFSLRWSVVLFQPNKEMKISCRNIIHTNLATIYSLDADGMSGRYNLVINASTKGQAGTYACHEFESGEKFSAYLLVLGMYIFLGFVIS